MKNAFTLICFYLGSLIMWLVLRKRSLKDEVTVYELNFQFYRNFSVGLIAICLLLFLIW